MEISLKTSPTILEKYYESVYACNIINTQDAESIWVKIIPRGLAGDLQAEGAFGFTLSFEDLNEDDNDSLCVNPVA